MEYEVDQNKLVIAEAPHTYRTEIPNMVDDMNLSPQAFRLYARIKRRAGDEGICYESTENLAKACGIGKGTISTSKQELVKVGLISIKTVKHPHGGRDYHEITILDVWWDNFTKYKKSTSSPTELASSPTELASSPGELKKNPIKNNSIVPESKTDSVIEEPSHTVLTSTDSINSNIKTNISREVAYEECDEDGLEPKLKAKDTRSRHPAIVAYKSVTKRFPNKALYDKIIRLVGDHPDVPFMKRCFETWIERSSNPSPYKWLFEWYVNRKIDTTYQPQKQEWKPAEIY